MSFSPDPVAGHKIDRMVDGLHDEFGGEFTRDRIAELMGDGRAAGRQRDGPRLPAAARLG